MGFVKALNSLIFLITVKLTYMLFIVVLFCFKNEVEC